MDVAFASNGSTSAGLASFIPLLIFGLVVAFVFKSIAKRKGKNQWFWFFLGFIPICWIAGIWLASLADKSVPSYSQPSEQSTVQEKWQCNCGEMNNMDETNCPNCGLKRDFLLAKKS